MPDQLTGQVNAVLGGISIGRPAPPETYFGVARALVPAVQLLASNKAGQGIPVAFLAAHAAECALKAYLSRNGDDSEIRNSKIRHDLVALWARAVTEGLEVPDVPPAWLQRLGEVHGRPYYLRYSTNVHGIVTPNPAALAAGLTALLDTVDMALHGAR